MPGQHFEERSGLILCPTSFGRWYQTVAEVVIEVELEAGTTSKMVKVDIKPTRLNCVVKDKVVFEGSPFCTVTEDDSVWTLEDRKLLRIQLVKANSSATKGVAWMSLLKEDGEKESFEPDAVTLHEMRKKIDLEMFQIDNPGLDFSGAKMNKNYDEKYQGLAERDLKKS